VNEEHAPRQQSQDELSRLHRRVIELGQVEEVRRASYATRFALDAAEMLERRNRELALLHEMTQAFAASLDLDRVVWSVLDETRRLLNVSGTSIWLLEEGTRELVCWQSTGEDADVVQGWRLRLGEGLAGWAARSGETLIVADSLADERHIQDIERQTGVPLRSILSVPLKASASLKDGDPLQGGGSNASGRDDQAPVIGVLQVLDQEVDRFDKDDLALVEPLAASAAVAIENARLYQETDRLRAFNENIVQSMEEGILVEDAEGRITFVNRKLTELLGYRADELIGQPWTIVADPALGDMVTSEATGQEPSSDSHYETALLARDGRWVPVLASARPLQEFGRPSGVLSVFTDITELKQAEEELRQSEEKLERARRMESLGVLAGGVAHDLNNLLGPMMAYPDLILLDLPTGSPLREDVQQIKLAAQRSAAMVQDLLTLARRGIYRTAPLNLNGVVDEYLRSPAYLEFERTCPTVRVVVDLASDLPNVMGSPVHLSKVVMNLVANAFEAMPQGGTLTISTCYVALDRPLAGYEHIEAGEYVLLRVGDTGVGIERGDVEHIFEPFYSKKEMGRSGSGLGLAVVYGVAHDHRARIDLCTEVGVGSEFALYFPVTGPAAPQGEPQDADYTGSESVLVIDDQPEQRDVATRLLSTLGYRVASVDSGQAALDHLERHRADILVLDMILGDGLDGLDTYREIVRRHPGQKAVIASGFSETSRVREAESLGAGQFVRKPYTLHSLGRAVRGELDRGDRDAGGEAFNADTQRRRGGRGAGGLPPECPKGQGQCKERRAS
jgi:PAS domain S-box-containing protein